jgi:hypothetical protein
VCRFFIHCVFTILLNCAKRAIGLAVARFHTTRHSMWSFRPHLLTSLAGQKPLLGRSQDFHLKQLDCLRRSNETPFPLRFKI